MAAIKVGKLHWLEYIHKINEEIAPRKVYERHPGVEDLGSAKVALASGCGGFD